MGNASKSIRKKSVEVAAKLVLSGKFTPDEAVDFANAILRMQENKRREDREKKRIRKVN